MSLLHALAGTAVTAPSEPPPVSEDTSDVHEAMDLEHDGASEAAPVAH